MRGVLFRKLGLGDERDDDGLAGPDGAVSLMTIRLQLDAARAGMS